jgi:hypothetical protein
MSFYSSLLTGGTNEEDQKPIAQGSGGGFYSSILDGGQEEEQPQETMDTRLKFKDDLVRKLDYIREQSPDKDSFDIGGGVKASEALQFVNSSAFNSDDMQRMAPLIQSIETAHKAVADKRNILEVGADAFKRGYVSTGAQLAQAGISLKPSELTEVDKEQLQNLQGVSKNYELEKAPRAVGGLKDVAAGVGMGDKASRFLRFGVESISENLPRMAGAIAGGIGGGIVAGPVGAGAGAAIAGFGQNLGEAVSDQVDEGQDLNRGLAFGQAAGYSAIDSVLSVEKMAGGIISQVFKKSATSAGRKAFVGTLKAVGKTALKGGVEEAINEPAQSQIVGRLRRYLQTGSAMRPGEDMTSAMWEAADEAAGGFMSGIGLGGGASAIQYHRDTAEAKTTRKNAFLNNIVTSTGGSMADLDQYDSIAVMQAINAEVEATHLDTFGVQADPKQRAKIKSDLMNVQREAVAGMSDKAKLVWNAAHDVLATDFSMGQVDKAQKSTFNFKNVIGTLEDVGDGNQMGFDKDSGIGMAKGADGTVAVYNQNGLKMPADVNPIFDNLKDAAAFAEDLARFNDQRMTKLGPKFQLLTQIAQAASPGANVRIVDTPAQLPASVKKQYVALLETGAPGQAMYDGGKDGTDTIYIVHGNIQTVGDAIVNINHEAIHSELQDMRNSGEKLPEGMDKDIEEQFVSAFENRIQDPGAWAKAKRTIAIATQNVMKKAGLNTSFADADVAEAFIDRVRGRMKGDGQTVGKLEDPADLQKSKLAPDEGVAGRFADVQKSRPDAAARQAVIAEQDSMVTRKKPSMVQDEEIAPYTGVEPQAQEAAVAAPQSQAVQTAATMQPTATAQAQATPDANGSPTLTTQSESGIIKNSEIPAGRKAFEVVPQDTLEKGSARPSTNRKDSGIRETSPKDSVDILISDRNGERTLGSGKDGDTGRYWSLPDGKTVGVIETANPSYRGRQSQFAEELASKQNQLSDIGITVPTSVVFVETSKSTAYPDGRIPYVVRDTIRNVSRASIPPYLAQKIEQAKKQGWSVDLDKGEWGYDKQGNPVLVDVSEFSKQPISPAVTPTTDNATLNSVPTVSDTGGGGTTAKVTQKSMEQAATEKHGFKLAKRRKVDLYLDANGKAYKKARPARIKQVIDEDTVSILYHPDGGEKGQAVIETVPISRLSERRSTQGSGDYHTQLNILNDKDRKIAKDMLAELKGLVNQTQELRMEGYEQAIDKELSGMMRGTKRGEYYRAQLERLADVLEIEDFDVRDYMQHVDLLEPFKKWLKNNPTGLDGKRVVAEMKTSEPTQMYSDEIQHTDLVHLDGEWFKVDRVDDTAFLQDGVTIPVEDGNIIQVGGVLSKEDAGYKEAMAEYQKQERENRDAKRKEKAQDASFNPSEFDEEMQKEEAQAFELETSTPEQIKTENKKKAEKDEIQRRLDRIPTDNQTAAELDAPQLDLGGDATPTDLFGAANVVKKEQSEKPSTPEQGGKTATVDKTVFDSDYTGPRFTYGMKHRPLSIGAQPKGYIIDSYRDSDEFRHGTIQYPRQLTEKEVYDFELTPVEEAKTTPPPPAPKKSLLDNVKSPIDNVSDAKKARLAAIQAELKGMLGRTNAGIDPKFLTLAVEMASIYVEGGVKTFAQFAQAVKQDMAEVWDKIKNELSTVWYRTAQENDSLEEVTGKQAKAIIDALDAETKADGHSTEIGKIVRDENMDSAQKTAAIKRYANNNNLMVKEAQEIAELEIVRLANDIAASGMSERRKRFEILKLYEEQPNLNARTSTSVGMQAYSTPAPLAYMIAERVDSIGKSVYDPTAGNGMLLVGANLQESHANELDKNRFSRLQELGIGNVTNVDAVNKGGEIPGVDVVITNPPFGTLPIPVKYNGSNISKLEHIIALRALESMPDDGKAAIIIGAQRDEGAVRGRGAQWVFDNYLYGNYNVSESFDVDGSLYSKQGASFPVRVYIIDGRKQNGQTVENDVGTIDRLTTWQQVMERLTRKAQQNENENQDNPMDAQGQTGIPMPQEAFNDAGVSPRAGNSNGSSRGGRGARGSRGSGGLANKPSAGNVNVDQSQASDQPSIPDVPVLGDGVRGGQSVLGLETERDAGDGRTGGEQGRDGITTRRDKPASIPGPEVRVNERQVAYVPSNDGDSMGTLTPSNIAKGTKEFLEKMRESVGGDIVSWLADKLNTTKDQIYKTLGAEQIDGVALGIYQIENGGALIIGDETGIGKGRQVASVLRWAQLNGKIPIFFTQDPKLFSDIYRDFGDIGAKPSPFIMGEASKSSIKDADGKNVLYAAPSNLARQKEFMRNIREKGLRKAGFDSIFATYSQIRDFDDESGRQSFLEQMATDDDVVIVMDESHNMSGDKNTSLQAAFFVGGQIDRKDETNGRRRRVLRGLMNMPGTQRGRGGIMYSSATYAKRAENMSAYFRTSIRKASTNMSDIIETIKKGGVAIQQAISEALANTGEYIRRERDFTGVNYNVTVTKTANDAKLVDDIDEIADALAQIVDFSKEIKSAVAAINRKTKAALKSTAITVPQMDVTDFASVVHNQISQMLFAAKSNAIIENVMSTHKKGEKSIVAFVNTMESFLNRIAQSKGLKNGQKLSLQWNDLFLYALEQTLRVSEKDAGGNETISYMSPDDLGLRKQYDFIQKVIGKIKLDVPVMPIDYIKQRLESNGLKVAELTARTSGVHYVNSATGEVEYRTFRAADKNAVVGGFNNGTYDVVLLNASGSTGISMHATAKTADKRKRNMFIAQVAPDINTFVQTLGRIKRTGMLPGSAEYHHLVLPVESERRPAAVAMRKMKSLNANTTSEADSDVNIVSEDFLNKYGNIVVRDWLTENQDIADMLDIEVDPNETPKDDLAQQFSGRMQLMPNDAQKRAYEEILANYSSLIELMKQTGEYDLEVVTHEDWDGLPVSKDVLSPGTDDSNIFTAGAKIERWSVSDKRHVPTSEEMTEAWDKNIGDEAKIKQTIEDRLEKQGQAIQAQVEDTENKHPHLLIKMLRFSTMSNAVDRIGYSGLLNRNRFVELRFKDDNGNITTYLGKLVEIGLPNERANITPSNIGLKFMVNSPNGFVNLKLSNFMNGDKVNVRDKTPWSFDTAYEGDIVKPETTREERYFITGNPVAGFTSTGGLGKYVRFRANDGSLVTGIMMSRGWGPNQLVKDPRYELVNGKAAAKFLFKFPRPMGISVGDWVVRKNSAGRYYVDVPAAKRTGGEVFLDDKLTETLEFQKDGSRMKAEVYPADYRNMSGLENQVAGVIDRIMEISGSRFKPHSNLDADMKKRVEESNASSQTASDQTVGTRFRRAVTPSEDAAYMAAVEAGDTATAQRMVDEAAKAAGYNVGPVWHAGPEAFNVFKRRYERDGVSSASEASRIQRYGKGIFFSSDENVSKNFGSINRRFFLRMDYPVEQNLGGANYYDGTLHDPETGEPYLGDDGKPMRVDQDHLPDEAAELHLDDTGKFNSGVIVRGVYESIPSKGNPKPMSDIYIVGNPSQIKSADAVTYDDSGAVVPLSERFNEETNDVRFRRAVKDNGYFEAANALVTEPGEVRFRRAYHGSPHIFDKFSLSRIGSGEGNQAYGWGLYFADHRDVANTYRKLGKKEVLLDGKPIGGATEVQEVVIDGVESFGDYRSALDWFVSQTKFGYKDGEVKRMRIIDAFKTLGPRLTVIDHSAIYEVELGVEDDALLDWQKPLFEQEIGARILNNIRVDHPSAIAFALRAMSPKEEELTGAGIYISLSKKIGEKAASEYLSSLGIRGIKYLDQNSRNGSEYNTSNYVIFNESDIKIVSRNKKTAKGYDEEGRTMFRRGVSPRDDAEKRYVRALPSTDPRARELQAQVETAYAYNLTPETVQESMDKARGVYEGDKTKLQMNLLAGQRGMSDTKTETSRMAVNRIAVDELTMDAVNNPTDRATATAMLATRRYYEQGSDIARALHLRVDKTDTPEGRRAWLLRTIYAPTKTEAQIIDRFEETERIIQELIPRAKFARAVLMKLKAKKIDIATMTTAKLMDDVEMAKILRMISVERSGWGDIVHEWWRNSILSAPTTQIVNAVGNLANASLEAFVQRPVEAFVNSFVKNPDAATFSSITAMYKAVTPSMKLAVRNFWKSFDTEESVTGPKSSKLDESDKAISDKFGGRIIRIPQRIMVATDEYFKTIFMAMLTADHATREFERLVKEGKQAETNRAPYIAAQMTPDSGAYSRAWDETLRWSFQHDVGAIAHAVMRVRNDPQAGFFFKFLFPFVKTPANIIASGIRKTPLGAIPYVWKLSKNSMSGADKMRLGAEQAVAFALTAALYALMKGDDDDELNRPLITGTRKSKAYTPKGQKENEMKNAPPMSIRVGDKWVSYSRLEPAATMVATIIDALTAWDQMADGRTTDAMDTVIASMRGNLSDKTFLQGLGNIVRMTEGDIKALVDIPKDIAVGFVPNAIRSPLKGADPYIRDMRVRDQGQGKAQVIAQRFGQELAPAASIAPIPKMGQDGKPIEREGGALYNSVVPFRLQDASKTTKVEGMLSRWNEKQDPKERWWPETPDPVKVKIGREEISMTDAEYAEYQRIAGEHAAMVLGRQTFNYNAPTERDVQRVKDIYENARKLARERVRPMVVRRWREGQPK